MENTDDIVTSCGAVVYRLTNSDVQILLVKHRIGNNAWGIPKGHLEAPESVEECVRREVKEETGCDLVEIEQRLDEVYSHPMGAPAKKLIAFIARTEATDTPLPQSSEEIAEAKFFSTKQLPNLHRYQTTLIKDAASMLSDKYMYHGRE